MSKKITSITMGVLALLLMLATPSFAQRDFKGISKTRKTSAIEQFSMRGEVMKKHPALARMQSSLKDRGNVFKNTVVGKIKAKRDAELLAGDNGPMMTGTLIYDESEELGIGIYNFEASANPQFELIGAHSYLSSTTGGVIIDNKYYYSYYMSFFGMVIPYHSVFNIETGEMEIDSYDDDLSLVTSGSCITYDQSKGLGYGLFLNADGSELDFCSMDYSTWTKTVLGKLGHQDEYLNMASDSKGGIYGVTVSGDIYKIDINTLQETLVASTGVDAQYIQPSAIDSKTNTLYWAYITAGGADSGLLKVDLTSGEKNFIGSFSRLMEWADLTIAAPAADDKAPASVTNLKAYIENEAPNDVKVSFLLPEKTFDGVDDLTGMLEFSIFVNNELWVKASGQPGAAVLRNLENVPSGVTTITVVVRNNVGDSPKAKTTLFVGLDVPQAPETATLSVDEAGNATINWTPVGMEGVNGGYVNTDNVTYTITRYPDGAVVAEGIKGNDFTETVNTNNLTMLSYGVSAVYNDAKGPEALTNTVKVGSSYTAPAGDDFTQEATFGLYTVVDANEDGRTWILNNGIPSCQYHGTNASDDWLITAPIKLQAGKLYLFTCDAGPYSTIYVPERIEVALGQGVDPADLGTQLIDPTDLFNRVTLENAFTVEADGEYNIGFHAISDADMFYTQVYSWSISAPIDMAAPDKAFNAALVPDVPGALTAKIQFNAPLKAINGEDLTGNVNIKVVGKNTEFEQILTDVQPGSIQSIPVSFEEKGVYSYTIIPSNENGEGLPVTISKFIGLDEPADVQNIVAYDNFDGTATFTWDALSDVGINGGYVDPAGVTYVLYEVTEDGYLGEQLAETTDLSYVYASDRINDGATGMLQLVVQAVTEEGESDYAVGSLICGTPAQLPYAETFPANSIDNYWWVSSTTDDAWALYGDDFDGSGGCAGYEANTVGGKAYLCTEKISVKGAVNPKMLFAWAALPQYKLKIRVLGDRQDGKEPVELKVIDCMDITELEMKHEVVDLSAFTNDPYVIVKFEAEAEETGGFFEFDAVKIYDVYSNDLAVELTVPRAVNVGDNIQATAVVSNIGGSDVAANDYTVKLYFDGKEVDSFTETDALEAYNGIAVYSFSVPTTVFFGSPTNVKVEVVYNYDLDTENNVAEGSVNVRQSSLARVNDLTAETGGWPAVLLRWSAPVIEDVQGEIVTEDFEDQEIFVPLSVGGITADIHEGALGSWKLYDGNNGIGTYGLNGGPQYENNYAPMAYQVMNPTVAGFDLSDENYAAMMSPNSGDQYLMSWNSVDENSVGAVNDKWLISPLLSGEAQTISFFVSEIVTTYGPEDYEVLYSTTDNAIESFVKLADGQADSQDWTEVTYDLPAGAKYFAIRMVSHDVFAFQVDDITYSAAAAKMLSLATEITGYNIYRDGKLIASVGADVNSYVDINETDGEHTYYVTVLYGDKESGLSNGATVVTAISELTSDDSLQDADITVYATNGAIVASGKGVYSGLAKGVYVIRNNETGLVKGVSKK